MTQADSPLKWPIVKVRSLYTINQKKFLGYLLYAEDSWRDKQIRRQYFCLIKGIAFQSQDFLAY